MNHHLSSGRPGPDMSRIIHSLDQGPALTLLGNVPVGRVAFTRHALPTMCAVNHIVDDGVIVVRSHRESALVSYAGTAGAVIAYEADDLDRDQRLSWSVVVTGVIELIHDPDLVTRYEQQLPGLDTG